MLLIGHKAAFGQQMSPLDPVLTMALVSMKINAYIKGDYTIYRERFGQKNNLQEILSVLH